MDQTAGALRLSKIVNRHLSHDAKGCTTITSSPSPRLPPELCDNILDYIEDDHPSLAACGLANRAWLARARAQIFHSVSIRGAEEYRCFKRLLKRSPAVAGYVRKFSITSLRCDTNRPDTQWSGSDWPRLLLRLRNLEELTVMWLKFKLPGDVLSAFRTGSRSLPIKTLRFAMLSMREKDIKLVLSACPKLSALWLTRCAIPEPSVISKLKSYSSLERVRASLYTLKGRGKAGSSQLSLALPSLDHVAIDTLIYDAHPFSRNLIVPWLIERPNKIHLRRLALRCEPDHPFVNACTINLLQSSGTQLESLSVDVLEGFRLGPRSEGRPCLTSNTNLASLYVNVPLTHPERGFCRSWDGLLEVLSDIESRHAQLQHIQIVFSPSHELCATFDWAALDDQLVRIAEDHPRVALTFYALPVALRREPYAWMSDFATSLLDGMPRVLASSARISVMWFDKQQDAEKHCGEGVLRPLWCS